MTRDGWFGENAVLFGRQIRMRRITRSGGRGDFWPRLKISRQEATQYEGLRIVLGGGGKKAQDPSIGAGRSSIKKEFEMDSGSIFKTCLLSTGRVNEI